MVKICSFNIKNNFFKHKNKTEDIICFIKKYKIDILGLQEYLFRESNKFYLDGYSCIGKGRLFRFKNVYNETNSIITKYKVEYHRTIKLPWLFTTFPRIMNYSRLNINGKVISIINTHLDFMHIFSKRKQLDFIYRFLKKEVLKNEVVLLGDFNMTIKDKSFINFINNLNKIGIQRVDLEEKTFKYLSNPIDHIFISKNIKLKSKTVLKDEDFDISDHYPLIIDFTLK